MAGLDEDSIDEVLYLARANEAAELESYLGELATRTGRSKVELLTAAIDPYSKNSALHYAAANGHNDTIKLLFSTSTEKPAPEFLNAVNDAGNTPLHWAALNGHLESVKLLVQSGADVTVINKAGHDAVYEAEINDKNEVVDWLLGTVEELEKGIGQTDEGAPEGDDGDGVEDAPASEQDATGKDTEDMQKHMENMKT